jgi:hypothetical protein
MPIRRHTGLFLVISAVCMLFGLSGSASFPLRLIALIATVLFILTVPGIHAFQPGGPTGLAGIILVEIAAVIALAFQIGLLSDSSHAGTFAQVSAGAGILGRLIIGWITTRKKVFPAWVGWVFIAGALLNFAGSVFHFGSNAAVFSVLIILMDSAALFGYGITIFRRQEG